MSKSRKSFLTILQEQFKDEKIKNSCIAAVNDLQMQTRAFDYLQEILPNDDLDQIANEFRQILALGKMNSQDFYVLSPEGKNKFIGWINKLIILGCDELLDANFKIKAEIVNLVQYKQSDPLDPWTLISAYVGGINQHLTPKIDDLIKKEVNLTSIWEFINYFSGKLIRAEIKQRNPEYVPNDKKYIELDQRPLRLHSELEADQEDDLIGLLMKIPEEHPVAAAIVTFTSLGVVGGLLATAFYSFYKAKQNANHAESRNDHESHRPQRRY